MKFPRCSECGGEVALATRPGRTRQGRYGVFSIPDDFKTPICSQCGEQFMVPEISDVLDLLIDKELLRVGRLISECDWKKPAEVLGAAKLAASIGADQDATLIFARYLAALLGVKVGSTGPVAFIQQAPEDLKKVLEDDENRLLARAIRRVTPLVVGQDEDSFGALAVYPGLER